jgi:hypothetical protein
MFKMGPHDSFGHLKTQVMAKKRTGISFCAGGVPHNVGKLSTRATTLL